jgi:hypothetical protein
MTKRAIVAHATEWAIVDFGPNFSARTDFSSPTAQKALFFCLNRFVLAEPSRHILTLHSNKKISVSSSRPVFTVFVFLPV